MGKFLTNTFQAELAYLWRGTGGCRKDQGGVQLIYSVWFYAVLMC